MLIVSYKRRLTVNVNRKPTSIERWALPFYFCDNSVHLGNLLKKQCTASHRYATSGKAYHANHNYTKTWLHDPVSVHYKYVILILKIFKQYIIHYLAITKRNRFQSINVKNIFSKYYVIQTLQHFVYKLQQDKLLTNLIFLNMFNEV